MGSSARSVWRSSARSTSREKGRQDLTERALRLLAAVVLLALAPSVAHAQKRMVLIDQDGNGPADSNQMSMMALLKSPQTDVLGITIVTGDGWRDEEVLHTLRMLEVIGRTDVPVVPGANGPLVRTQARTQADLPAHGPVGWFGAWGKDGTARPPTAPRLPEGLPHGKPLKEDAPHFLIRQIRAHPGAVTIYAAGPLTNIARALSIDPGIAGMTKGIVIMGGSLNPQTDDPEFSKDPRHEFNFWFDPEAAHAVLRAGWPRIDVTTVDISIKAKFTDEIYAEISKSSSPSAKYIAAYATDRSFLWDELTACAWLDPSIITKRTDEYLDVDLSRGPGYGHTIAWGEKDKPSTGVRLAHVQDDLDLPRLRKMFIDLMTSR
jgi:inosine-uridine nucleoside N-ribohydrolase